MKLVCHERRELKLNLLFTFLESIWACNRYDNEAIFKKQKND